MNIQNLSLIDINEIQNLLQVNLVGFCISIGIFLAVIIFNAFFYNYKVFSFKVFFAWLLASVITFFYMLNDDTNTNMLSINLNSLVILDFFSNAIMFICFIFSLIANNPKKRTKNYGKHTWWIEILAFIVRVAFYSAFNIILFVIALYFYL